MMMQTVRQAIDNYTVPELDICPQGSSEISPLPSHPRQIYKYIQHWSTFEQELAAFSSELEKPFDGSLIQLRTAAVCSEMSLFWEFSHHISEPFLSVVKSLGHDYRMRDAGGLSCIKLDPNLVLLKSDCTSPICLVEFKEPWDFSITGEFDVAHCIRQEECGNEQSRKVSAAVAQLHGYMTYNNMKYGILTNYNYSIFFSLSSSDESTLLYSSPVPSAYMVRVLVQFFFMIKDNAVHTPRKARSVNDLKPFYCPVKNQLTRIEPEHFLFTETISDIKQGGVVTGYLGGGTGPVVFKVKNIARKIGVDALIQREANNYQALKDLQGIAIPVFHGLVDFNGVFHGAITEHCGTRMQRNGYDKEIALRNAINALGMIHAKGFLHGSIARRNICVDALNNVRLIDLEFTRMSCNQADFDYEMNDVCRLFS